MLGKLTAAKTRKGRSPKPVWGLGGRTATCSRDILSLASGRFGKDLATETNTNSSNDVLQEYSGCAVGPHMGSGMTSDNQTLTEAARLRASLTSPNHVVNIGFWNVRTMFQTSKAAQVASEFRRYRLDILGISECRWSESGKLVLNSGEMILWSGRENEHESGTALMLGSLAVRSLVEWKAVSDRIVLARFRSRFVMMTVVVCYAPTNNADEEVKERYYEQLQETISRVNKHDVLVVGGDMNAKVGNDNSGRERCMERFGLGTMNENGHLFTDFCQENGLVIGGTMYRHKDLHKYTWESPDGRTRNQIDHITINRKWAASMKDVRTRRGADVGSDHVLLVAKIQLSLRSRPRTEGRRKLDVGRLKCEEKAEEFKLKVSNRFEVLEDKEVEDIDEYWMELRDTLKEASEEVLGYGGRKKEEWMSEGSWEKLGQRKEIKKGMLREDLTEDEMEVLKGQYKEKDGEVKKSVRLDKRRFMEGKAAEAEEAAGRGDSRTLYQISKSLGKGKSFGGQGQVKNGEGEILAGEDEQRERWAEHFQGVLNREEPQSTPDFEVGEPLEISTEAFSLSEVTDAIGKMKSNKAAGSDGIAAELFKVCTGENAVVLGKLFEKVWSEEKIPEEWLKGNIIKLPKKGDLKDCNNWRGVTLLNVASKIFARCIFERIQSPIDNMLRKHQAGFRRGRSCVDQIFVMRRVIEEAQEFQKELVVNFVDFEKAFDSVFREALWNIMKEYGIPEKLIIMIRTLYDNFQCAVLHEGKLSPYFLVETGVKQGCLLSGLLFLLVIDWLMKRTTENRRTGIEWVDGEVLEDVDFSDDLGLVSENVEDAQEKIKRLARKAKSVGLKVSAKKTQILRLNSSNATKILVEGQELEEVDKFVYLGGTLTKTGGSSEDVDSRIRKARAAFVNLSKIWSSNVYSARTKLTLFNSIVKSTLLYGCECWTLTKSSEKKLQVFQQKCLRRIMRIFYPNLVTNVEVLRRARQEDVMADIVVRKWRWVGHIARREPQHLSKQAMSWHWHGHRRRGRPRETWMRVAERELFEVAGMKMWEVEEHAQDRGRWRRLVDAVRIFRIHRA